MIEVTFKIDVALDAREHWPTCLPGIPRVGDFVQSGYYWSVPVYETETDIMPQQIALEVASIIWKGYDPSWYPEIYLRPGPQFNSLTQFRAYYAKLLEVNS